MTPSICNGCATGCNREIQHKDERAWRLVPRLNANVNQYWMCDEGRLTYHQLRDDRLATWIARHVQFPCTMVDRIVPSASPDDRVRARAVRFSIPCSGWPVRWPRPTVA